MKRLGLLFLFWSFTFSNAYAAMHEIQRGITTTIPVKFSYLRESMIVLPEAAQSVTGVSKPAFQVEPGQGHIMIRPLQDGSKGNLFIDLGHRTLVVLSLQAVSSGGEDVVELQYSSTSAVVGSNKHDQFSDVIPNNLQFLAAAWKIEKLNSTGKNSGLVAHLRYAVRMGDIVLLHFSLKNKSSTPFSIARIVLQRCTLGGFAGTSVLLQDEIPARIFLNSSEISEGDEVTGSLLFPFIYLDHDQVIAFRALNQREQGPEVRWSL